MPVQVTCKCGQKLKAPDNLAGKTVRCPKCKEPLKIPALVQHDVDLELELSAPSTSNSMDDLLSSELPSAPAMTSPLGPTAPQQAPVYRPPVSAGVSHDGMPSWMLWAIGGITAFVLLGLVSAMLLTYLLSGSDPKEETMVAEAAVNSAPDENVAKAFAEKKQPAESTNTTTTPAPAAEAGSNTNTTPAAQNEPVAPAEKLTADELAKIAEELEDDQQATAEEWGIDPEELKNIKETLVTLNEITQRRATNELETVFAMDRALEECERRGYVKNIALVEPERVSQNFTNLIAGSLVPILGSLDMKDSDFRFAALSEDGDEAEVIMEIDVPEQFRMLKLRWWLTKRTNKWQVYDLELLQLGIRQSALMVLSFASTPADIAEQQRAVNCIHALNNAWQATNNDALGQYVDQLDEFQVTPDIDTLRHILRGRWHQANEDFEEALAEFKIVQERSPQTTLTYLLQAASLTQLGRYQTALQQIREYERRLGRDDESWAMLGYTLYAAGETEQGLAAFRKGMQYNPNSIGCLVLMAEALSEDSLAPIQPYIVEDALPLPAFQQLALRIQQLGYQDIYDYLMKARRESQRQ